MTTVAKTLAERAKTHGSFDTHALIEQKLIDVLDAHDDQLDAVHLASMRMMMHKMARILNGNPDYADHWHDIQGYAALAEDYVKEVA